MIAFFSHRATVSAAAFELIILGIRIMKLVLFAAASQRGLRNLRFEYSLVWPSLFSFWLSNTGSSVGFILHRVVLKGVPEAVALSH